jgi:hypothetical protein
MLKIVIIFIILTGILITGIFILMKPSIFNSSLSPYGDTAVHQSTVGNTISKQFITIGSTLAIVGLVGLSVLGFRIFKNIQAEANTER